MVAATQTLKKATQRVLAAVGIFLVSIASAAAVFLVYRSYLQQKITLAVVAGGTASKLITLPRAAVTQILDAPIIILSVGHLYWSLLLMYLLLCERGQGVLMFTNRPSTASCGKNGNPALSLQANLALNPFKK